MAIPSKEILGNIVIDFLQDGRLHSFRDIKSYVKREIGSRDYDLKKKSRDNTQPAWVARTVNVLKDLRRGGRIEMSKSGSYKLTDEGKNNSSDIALSVEASPLSTAERMSAKLQDIMQILSGDEKSADKVENESRNRFTPETEKRLRIILRSMKDDTPYCVNDFRVVLSDAGLNLNSNQLSGIITVLKHSEFVSYQKPNQYRITEAGKNFLIGSPPLQKAPIQNPSSVVADEDKIKSVSNHDERLERVMLAFMEEDRLYTRQNFKDYIRLRTDLSDADLNKKVGKGDSAWENAVDWAVYHLFDKGYIERPQRARYRITEAGKKFLSDQRLVSNLFD